MACVGAVGSTGTEASDLVAPEEERLMAAALDQIDPGAAACWWARREGIAARGKERRPRVGRAGRGGLRPRVGRREGRDAAPGGGALGQRGGAQGGNPSAGRERKRKADRCLLLIPCRKVEGIGKHRTPYAGG